jgi:hypothetical protein
VKRLLSFMELDNDLEDQNAQNEEVEPIESPSEIVKPVARKGLTQQSRPKPPVFVDLEQEQEEEEEEEEEQSMVVEDVGGYEDGGYGLGDDSYGQYEGDEQPDDDMEEVEEEPYEKPATPPVKRNKGTLKASKPAKKLSGPHSKPQIQEPYYGDEYEEQAPYEEDEEEDIYGQPPSASPPPQPKPQSSRAQKSKKPTTSRPRKQSKQTSSSSSSQPTKRARTTSTAPRSPKIIERREVPHAADISTLDGDGSPLPYPIPT